MAIFKAKVESNYTVIPNKTAQDSSVSFEARGMLSLMLSLPDDWEIHKTWLLNQSPKCGRDKLTRIMLELQTAGYVVKKIKQTEQGKMDGVDWFVYSTVQLETRTTDNTEDVKPDTTKETSLQKKQINKGDVDSDSKPKADRIEWVKVKDAFNGAFIEKTNDAGVYLEPVECSVMTPKRKELIKKLMKDCELTQESLLNYIFYAGTSGVFDFYREDKRKSGGKFGPRPFDWYFNIENFVKAKEA